MSSRTGDAIRDLAHAEIVYVERGLENSRHSLEMLKNEVGDLEEDLVLSTALLYHLMEKHEPGAVEIELDRLDAIKSRVAERMKKRKRTLGVTLLGTSMHFQIPPVEV